MKYTGHYWFLKKEPIKNNLYKYTFLITEDIKIGAYCFTKEGQKYWKESDKLWAKLQK